MVRFSAYLRLANSIAFTLLVAGLTAAQAQITVGARRPASVPAGYVITPFGYFHESCVTHLGQGDAVQRDKNAIVHANGTSENIRGCSYPHYNPKGEIESFTQSAINSQDVTQPTISHAWVEFGSARTTSSYGELFATWTVPPAPTTNDGQTVYLFPGMEDDADIVTIIQPVLGWNSDFASAWGIASWNCCMSGTVFESAPKRVNTGDTIYGYMYHTCAAGTLSCPTWNVVTWDVTSGNRTWLQNTSSFGQTFNWAFAGALEVYNIAKCSDYPPGYSVSFNNLELFTNSFARISNPGWSVSNSSSELTPQCGYAGSVTQSLTLDY